MRWGTGWVLGLWGSIDNRLLAEIDRCRLTDPLATAAAVNRSPRSGRSRLRAETARTSLSSRDRRVLLKAGTTRRRPSGAVAICTHGQALRPAGVRQRDIGPRH